MKPKNVFQNAYINEVATMTKKDRSIKLYYIIIIFFVYLIVSIIGSFIYKIINHELKYNYFDQSSDFFVIYIFVSQTIYFFLITMQLINQKKTTKILITISLGISVFFVTGYFIFLPRLYLLDFAFRLFLIFVYSAILFLLIIFAKKLFELVNAHKEKKRKNIKGK